MQKTLSHSFCVRIYFLNFWEAWELFPSSCPLQYFTEYSLLLIIFYLRAPILAASIRTSPLPPPYMQPQHLTVKTEANISQLNSTPLSLLFLYLLRNIACGQQKMGSLSLWNLYEVEGSFPKLTVNKVGKSRSQKSMYYFCVPCICSTASQLNEITAFVLIFFINIIWFLTVHILFLLDKSSSTPIQVLIQTAANIINCSHKREQRFDIQSSCYAQTTFRKLQSFKQTKKSICSQFTTTCVCLTWKGFTLSKGQRKNLKSLLTLQWNKRDALTPTRISLLCLLPFLLETQPMIKACN